MLEIVGVRFKKVGKIYYFDPQGRKLPVGERVIVETSRGIECGSVAFSNRMVEQSKVPSPLRPIIRVATPDDLLVVERNRNREKDAAVIFCQKVEKHNLQMNLIDVEYTFDTSKLLFFFTADGRVDFRELVKDLASVFRTRIELRQIGVRDEAKYLGGIGVCGRPLCCSTFLYDFALVSIKMAKEQGVSLNPVKISGACGRLMCCLNHEQETYEELLKTIPVVGSVVSTKLGTGTVISSSTLEAKVVVRFEKSSELGEQEFLAADVKLIKKPNYLNADNVDISQLKKLEG